MPTLTGMSSVACRRTGSNGKELIRRLNPVEGFSMNLWTPDMWRRPHQQIEGSGSFDLINDMAGNMWSLHHFVPLAISAFGCVDWRVIQQMKWKAKCTRPVVGSPGETFECISDSGSDSADLSLERGG